MKSSAQFLDTLKQLVEIFRPKSFRTLKARLIGLLIASSLAFSGVKSCSANGEGKSASAEFFDMEPAVVVALCVTVLVALWLDVVVFRAREARREALLQLILTCRDMDPDARDIIKSELERE